jgi:tetratricopeptide (TPR) repeat protein
MKPILIFFAKSRDVLNFGKKVRDREVEATTHYEKEIFRRYAITQLAKEFISIKVDTRKADRKLMARSYYVRRAPVVVILDIYGKMMYRLTSPKMNYRQLAKVMESAIKKTEKEVARLARSKEASPIVERAKVRYAEIEMRDLVDKGMAYCYDERWDKAEEAFKDVLGRKEDNQYKKKAQDGMMEIKAGKLYVEGNYLYKKKRYQQAKDCLDKVLTIKESKYFKQMATTLLKKVNKKLK